MASVVATENHSVALIWSHCPSEMRCVCLALLISPVAPARLGARLQHEEPLQSLLQRVLDFPVSVSQR